MTIAEHLRLARGQLEAAQLDQASPALEAELLLAHVLQRDRAFAYAHPEQPVSQEDQARFKALLHRRLNGEPLAYLTGRRAFWTMELQVSPQVLIPRPETELLVEAALDRIPSGASLRVADIGTGSGAIALALSLERPDCEVHGTDISEEAIEVARRNATRLKVTNLQLHVGHWCDPLQGKFELIASNPPYVAQGDAHLERGDCRFEPELALTPGADEFIAYRQILKGCRDRLVTGGWLLFEHGFNQGQTVQRLLRNAGYQAVATQQDLQGLDRMTLGQKSD